jgi:membrane-anchored protein YejM (alkaline phosphatase superfamily)
VAKVSMPVLNKNTLISRDFDDYKLMKSHNDFARMIDEMEFPDEPHYYFLNLGETHYPYMLSGENLPHISGVHGALKAMDAAAAATAGKQSFDAAEMAMLRQQQIKCVEYIDGQIGRLMAMTPPNTHFIVTADHGELFGEEGYFGHGPIMHEKCFEVPYVEGRLA